MMEGVAREPDSGPGKGRTTQGYVRAVRPVTAAAIETDTGGLAAGDITITSGGDSIPAYEAKPSAPGKYPVVVVISEIFGVHEHIKDVCRRFAKVGYYAIAPEMFVRQGDVAKLTDIPEILKIVMSAPRQQVLQDLSAAADHARRQPQARADRVGVTGFCWGGSTTIHFAAHYRDLRAAAAWYGPPAREYLADPPVSGFSVAKDITCPFLGLFGEEDTNPPPADVRKFEGMLKQHNKAVEIVIYPNAGHAFFADYRPNYRPAAAQDAWKRCVAWFDKYLKA
jgi:carboxymethylenebutenolidase